MWAYYAAVFLGTGRYGASLCSESMVATECAFDRDGVAGCFLTALPCGRSLAYIRTTRGAAGGIPMDGVTFGLCKGNDPPTQLLWHL